MKKTILKFSYILLIFLFGNQFVFADNATGSLISKTKDDFATSTQEKKFEDKKEEIKNDSASTTATTSKSVTKKIQKKTLVEDRKICEISNDLDDNLNTLTSTSETAQGKLKDIKETLNTEIEKRDSIVASIKSILTFKKSEVDILNDAKTDVEDAEVFYNKLDKKVVIEKEYSEGVVCEKVLRKELLQHYNVVDELTKSEDAFRKDFTKKLKQTMKLLVKDSDKKEKTKE